MRRFQLTILCAAAALGPITKATSADPATNPWDTAWAMVTNKAHHAQVLAIEYAKTNYPQYFREVPVTKRTEFNLLSPTQENELGNRFWAESMTNAISTDLSEAQRRLTNVASKLVSAAEPLVGTNAPAFDLRMLPDTNFNACCHFGGKILVNAGVLHVVRDDDEFSFVIAHEIGHAVARHAGETLTRELLRQKGIAAARFIADWTAQTRAQQKIGDLAIKGLDVASVLAVALPHEREQELEADHLGLILMSMARYRPQAAVDLWQRMADAQSDTNSLLARTISKYCSDHPPDAERVENLKCWLSQATNSPASNAP